MLSLRNSLRIGSAQQGTLSNLKTWVAPYRYLEAQNFTGPANKIYANDFHIEGKVYAIEVQAPASEVMVIYKIDKYKAIAPTQVGTFTMPSGTGSKTVLYLLPTPVSINENEAIGVKGRLLYNSTTVNTIGVWESSQVNGPYLRTSTLEMSYKLLVSQNEYISLYKDLFPTISATQWTLNGAWTTDGTGAVPPAIGETNCLQSKRIYHSDHRTMVMTVDMTAATILKIPVSFSGINAGEGASCFCVDMVNKKILMYKTGSGLDTQYTSSGYTATESDVIAIPANMVGTKTYSIEISKIGTVSKLVLTDIAGNCHVETRHDGWGVGRQNQLYGFYAEAGSFKIKSFEVFGLNRPYIVFDGDSITEGVYVYDRTKRYAELFRTNNPSRKVVISARGGAYIDTTLAKFDTEYNIYKPRYLSVTIGANGGSTLAKLQQLKANCDAIGCTLILNYRTCQSGDVHIAGNDIIAQIPVSHARFDIATALDGVPTVDGSHPSPRYDPALYADAGVHPNEIGDLAMYNRFILDIAV